MELDNKIIEDFKATLKEYYRNSFSVKVTDNKSTMLSYRKNKNHVFLRLNKMFLSAKEDVIEDIARYISGGKSFLLNKFIRQNTAVIKKSVSRKPKLIHQGDIYNLFDIYYEINFKYFAGEVNALVTWGKRMPDKRRKRSIVFGAYYGRDNLIRINRMLDNRDVPDFFIKYIMYHEMLHTQIKTRKGVMHCKEFKARERLFPDYEKAVRWQKANIWMFLG